MLVGLYAAAGDFGRAEETLSELESTMQKTDPWQTRAYQVAKGIMELEKGDPDAAVTSFEKSGLTDTWFRPSLQMARAYLEAGRLNEAVTKLEAMIRRYSEERAENPIHAALLYYYLGRAYEESGRVGKAIEQYTFFVDLWKNADPKIVEIGDARTRLARLNRS
jgi:tetratricopeptide (TPR) repeat protein